MKRIVVVGAAIVDAGRCLVAQRGATQSLPGKWEFPGGKVEPGESAPVALRREIEEELGLVVAVGQKLGESAGVFDGKYVALEVYLATVTCGTLDLREHAAAQWASADELPGFDWAEADVPIVAAVATWLRAEWVGGRRETP